MKLVLAAVTAAAAALLVVPGTAQAAATASPGHLAGTFSAVGTVTSSTYLKKGQDVYAGRYRFAPSCASGVCRTTMTFTPLDVDVQLSLAPASGGYSGTTTVLESCIDNRSTIASRAYRTTYTASKFRVTRRVGGKPTEVAGTMKVVSTLTPAGRAAGCASLYFLTFDFTATPHA